MKKLGFAVVGLGRIGKLHAEILRFKIENAKLVAVVDVVEDLARSVAERLGVKYYTDLDKALMDSEVDAVVIATPTFLHRDMIIQSARAGKHIFVEKPMTVTSSEARDVINAVSAAKVKLMVGYMRRFDHGYRKAKEAVERGEIGRVISFISIARDPGPPPGWAAEPSKSGGIFLDQLSHDFDIARWIVGEVSEVYVIGGNYLYEEIKQRGDLDVVSILFRFENGAQGFIQGTRRSVFGYDLRTEIYGEKGTIYIGSNIDNLYAYGSEKGVVYYGIPWFEKRFLDAYVEELKSFVDAVLNDRDPPITAVDGLRVIQIAEACWRSVKEGKPVTVPRD